MKKTILTLSLVAVFSFACQNEDLRENSFTSKEEISMNKNGANMSSEERIWSNLETKNYRRNSRANLGAYRIVLSN